jgi:hypothetical protein
VRRRGPPLLVVTKSIYKVAHARTHPKTWIAWNLGIAGPISRHSFVLHLNVWSSSKLKSRLARVV